MFTFLLALQAGWTPIPAEFKGTLDGLSAPKWSFLAAPEAMEHASLKADITILEPAKSGEYFGRHWSVWPDLTYSDGPWEAGFLLRGGYRVQLSTSLQEIALVKVPDGGYLRVAPCALGKSVALKVDVQGPTIVVTADGVEKIRYVDRVRPLGPGRFGVGANGGGKAKFENVELTKLPDAKPAAEVAHVPAFTQRKWLGGRQWIFDGQEPILMLPVAEQTYINNVKLRPGWKPLLSWNSHWDVQTQGAFKEADNKLESVDGLKWTFRHVNNKFVVRTAMELGWDAARQTYTYDIQSELEVLEAFNFRYGYDFEHHTPLDPFQWQYLILRREGGRVERRPVYPVDPGGMDAIAQSGGARVWYGRHNGKDLLVAPAVEYDIAASQRKMSTAVCAAFYDTGVAFGAETAPAGTKVNVKYRYTGWPAEEAKALFGASTPHLSNMLDPNHHYIFADDGLKISFTQAVPMTETWVYGRRPFMTGHNQRPSYAWVKDVGMKCGPGAYGKVAFPAPAGRYVARARVKADNVHGPGGRIEVGKTTHYVGAGSFDWKDIEFSVDVPNDKEHALAFGNAGTGDVYFGAFELKPGDGPPPAKPAAYEPAPPGAIADYRMEEQRGQHVLDYAWGPIGKLELANLSWVVDEGRPALRFAPSSTSEYPKAGMLDRGYLGTSGYAERRSVAAALAGHHGGGNELKGLSVVAWIKPDAKLPTNRGDIVGLGARRYILGLTGGAAPYRLEARINVNDVFTSEPVIEAGKWQKVSMSCAPEAGQWRVKIYADGKLLKEGLTKKHASPSTLAPSLVLGTEIFYFHDCYYRGLIGRVTVFDQP
ncbi:MAG TPA: LamG-like jellyroll fold domain-containing protein [Planctomycetota bacterium]